LTAPAAETLEPSSNGTSLEATAEETTEETIEETVSCRAHTSV
jgi:hypothetical protein